MARHRGGRKAHGGARNGHKKSHRKQAFRGNKLRIESDNDEDPIITRRGKRSTRKALQELNSMADMNNGTFSSIDEMALNAIHLDDKRSSKNDKRKARMADVASYTEYHHKETLSRNLRKMPIMFVRAAEQYEISKVLEKLGAQPGPTIEQQDGHDVESESEDETDQEVDSDLEKVDRMLGASHVEPIEAQPVDLEVLEVSEATPTSLEEDDEEDEVDEADQSNGYDNFDDDDSYSDSGEDSEESEFIDDDDIQFIDDNENDEYENTIAHETDSPLNYEAFNGALDSIDVTTDSSEPEITIGKFNGTLRKGNDGDYYVNLPTATRIRNFGFEEPQESAVSAIRNFVSEGSEQPEEEPSEPEFGFLDEDFIQFDLSKVNFDNFRLGAGDAQYHVSCLSLFNNDEFHWVGHSDLLGLLTDQGLPESRFDAYIKYATKHLEIPDMTELDLSDDDSSEIDEEMMEGMEDMLAFARSRPRVVNDPIDIGTHSLKISGKGRKRQLQLPEDLDDASRAELLGKFESRIAHRRRKNRAVPKGGMQMYEKYPFELTVNDFKDEMEAFLATDTQTLNFPPVDAHGIMTLRDMSRAFHLKPRKMGKGIEGYVQIVKTSSSKRLPPDRKEIDKLLNRRKYFMRADTGLTSDERKILRNALHREKKADKGKKARFQYKEGDVVGANASEIGPESVGRKMLVKMGWQNGDALGAEGNKGITVPISAVVKTSKIGIR